MELSEKGLLDRRQWEETGYELPQFNRSKVMEATKENPFWLHFGSGNIFRAFQSNVVQQLLNAGTLEKGLIVAEGFDYEIIDKINRPYDEYSILVILKADGSVKKIVIGSIMESCILDSENEKEYGRLQEIFSKDSLQMVSFTITEKGYNLVDGEGNFYELVKEDFQNGPEKTKSYMGNIAALLYTRYQAGGKPVAMVSMDNCSRNGGRLYAAIETFAKKWVENQLVDAGFLIYINDKQKVTFPWTMIDKITPRPDAAIEEILKEDGIGGITPVVTSKNTYAAPFVNAEECEYLVIEDAFPNGRPKLEKGGIMFVEREVVDKVEKMKVCTCLNPLHTALAVFGCLLGYRKISEEMNDEQLRKLVEMIGYNEGLPVVVNPGVLNPEEFLDTVLNIRLPNPFMPDTPQRIATDTSQKLATRFGETIKAYLASDDLETAELKGIPLVFAGWLRYLMAIDDEGREFSLSPDPLLDDICPVIKKINFGQENDLHGLLQPILENETIFGINLYEIGMADKVCGYLQEMTAGVGAVRNVLKKYTGE